VIPHHGVLLHQRIDVLLLIVQLLLHSLDFVTQVVECLLRGAARIRHVNRIHGHRPVLPFFLINAPSIRDDLTAQGTAISLHHRGFPESIKSCLDGQPNRPICPSAQSPHFGEVGRQPCPLLESLVDLCMYAALADMAGGSERFVTVWDIASTADFITKRAYSVIALQFPDDLLKDATQVQAAVADECLSRGHKIEACLLPLF